jgi:hypothetical protein
MPRVMQWSSRIGIPQREARDVTHGAYVDVPHNLSRFCAIEDYMGLQAVNCMRVTLKHVGL